MRVSRNSVKKVKWLMPEALASMCFGSMRNRRQMRLTPRGISWHIPTLRSRVARLMASVTRLIGFVRLMKKASGAYRSTLSQMLRVFVMLRSEWKTAPGPPFSPVIWVAPCRFGTS